LNYVQEVAAESHSEAQLTTAQDDDDLFSFMNVPGRQAPGSPVAKQVEEFMESKSTSLVCLKDYPQVARVFVKANSTLPSSAAVERLFSIAGMILSQRRCKMSDKLFDKNGLPEMSCLKS